MSREGVIFNNRRRYKNCLFHTRGEPAQLRAEWGDAWTHERTHPRPLSELSMGSI